MLLGLLAHPQSHPKLTYLKMGDEAVRSQPHAFAEFLNRRLRVQIYAKRHPEQHAQL